MKRHFITLLFLLPLLTHAQKHQWYGKAILDAGNVRCQINVTGDLFTNDSGTVAAFEVPKRRNPSDPSRNTMFVSGLWLGGKERGILKTAAISFRAQLSPDFFPGPLDSTTASIDSAEMQKYNKVWKLRHSEVDSFRKGLGTSAAILSWPGNPITLTKNQKKYLAPFVDMNGNGIYDPLTSGGSTSDYPRIKGDQACWWVMNDKGGLHQATGGAPLGVEIRCMAYSYNSPLDTALYNTVFVDYQFVYHGTTTLDSFMIGTWTDFDLGYYGDDYVGCDSARRCYFAYNGDNHDENKGYIVNGKLVTQYGYGSATPTQSVVFLNQPMSHFLYYDNDFSSYGNPDVPEHFYNYLQNIWKNGNPVTRDGKQGRVGGFPATNYMFDGDPLDSSSGSWTEKTAGNLLGDRRGVGSTGPILLKPGQIIDLSLAYVFSPGDSAGGPLSSVKRMQRDVTYIQNKWNTSGGYIPTALAENTFPATSPTLRLYPNPASSVLRIASSGGMKRLSVYDALGRIVHGVSLSGQREAALDLSHLPNGIYSVVVETAAGTAREKAIKK